MKVVKKRDNSEPTHLKMKLIPFYKTKVISSQVDYDIKYIKKMNDLFKKTELKSTEENLLECFNYLNILNNYVEVNKITELLLELIELDYHESLLYILTKIEFNELNFEH